MLFPLFILVSVLPTVDQSVLFSLDRSDGFHGWSVVRLASGLPVTFSGVVWLLSVVSQNVSLWYVGESLTVVGVLLVRVLFTSGWSIVWFAHATELNVDSPLGILADTASAKIEER